MQESRLNLSSWGRRAAGFLPLLLGGCTGPASMLKPMGPVAGRVTGWWWLMFFSAVAVLLVVVVLLLFGLLRSRRRKERAGRPRERAWLTFVVSAGGIVPAVTLSALMGLNLYSEHLVTAAAKAPGLTVEVTGHQWWWEFHYPEAGVTTANELHIPAGEPVKLKLMSADVIHSFWVPPLAGKLDLVPGHVNTLELSADRPGVFRGQCAEFCGVQHARMAFLVIADPPASFASWLDEQQKPAPEPAGDAERAGQEVFMKAGCVQCHTVRGTEAEGTVGPDLTHLASRLTLGAASLSNTEGNRAGWILDSQALKPGNRMPRNALEPSDLQDLLAWLASLE